MDNKNKLFDVASVAEALKDSFIKLDPRIQIKNPVMCIVYVSAEIWLLL